MYRTSIHYTTQTIQHNHKYVSRAKERHIFNEIFYEEAHEEDGEIYMSSSFSRSWNSPSASASSTSI